MEDSAASDSRSRSTSGAWAAHQFPFLQMAEHVGAAAVLYFVGRVLAGMDVPPVCAHVMWGLAVLVLLLTLGIQRTTLLIDSAVGTLTITWRAWWGGLLEQNNCHLDAIQAIRLTDERRSYRHGDETFLHGVTLHNWRLWAVLSDDDQVPLLPRGHGSGVFDAALGRRLAEALGVPFSKEVWERR